MNSESEMNEMEFDDKYSPNTDIVSECFDAGSGMLETFGPDLTKAVDIANTRPKTIWTCVDGDSGVYFTAGYHLINRIYYLITNEEWAHDDEEYLIHSNDEAEE